MLFLGEAVALAGLGGGSGIVVGGGAAVLLGTLIPALPVHLSVEYSLIALAMALSIGLLAGVLPARRAASLEPVEALREE